MGIRISPLLRGQRFLLHGFKKALLIYRKHCTAVLYDVLYPFGTHHILHSDPGTSGHHCRKAAGNKIYAPRNPYGYKFFSADTLIFKPCRKPCRHIGKLRVTCRAFSSQVNNSCFLRRILNI